MSRLASIARLALACLPAPLALAALFGATSAFAQTQVILDQNYAPWLYGGDVETTALQADGKLLVGGSFTAANGANRPGLARLNVNGTLDTGFAANLAIHNAGSNGYPYTSSIVPLPDGKVLIGGNFDQVGSPTLQTRQGVARLNADGTLDTSFVPPPMTYVTVGGVWQRVYRLLRLSNGKILVAGRFADIGSSGRARIARLNEDGTLDTGFQPVSLTGANPYVWALTEQADGRLIIGGGFDTAGGASHRNLARLEANGAVDHDFTIGVNGSVRRVLAQTDGRLVVTGQFNLAFDNDGAAAGVNGLVRFTHDLDVDHGFIFNGGSSILWAEEQADRKLLISGNFTSPPSKFARLLHDGQTDATYATPTIDGNVRNFVQQDDGRIIVAGYITNVGGVLRDNLARLAEVTPMTDVQAISASSRHTCAIHNGAAKCWGWNFYGQLGDNSTTDSRIPVQVQGLTSGVTAISAGSEHTCAIHNGAAKCWGRNFNGQLGNDSTTDSRIPVQVLDLTSGVTAISAGWGHTCAIHNGAAKCWGDNGGNLGNNSTTHSAVPVQVQGLTSGVTAISASSQSHSCAVHNGAAKCWGNNSSGQLGNNSTTNSLVPVQVQGLTNGVTAISAGSNSHTCAIHNGAAKCWGSNQFGQLGNNSSAGSLVPVQVQDLTNGVTAISAGWSYTCAIQNGAAKCWGRNNSGQLGNDSTMLSRIPVQVQGLTSDVTAIGAGGSHTCAIHNGAAKCWGGNSDGQLGNNSITDSLVPVQVLAPFPSPTPHYFVTPSVSGGNGRIDPDTPQLVLQGNSADFTFTPDPDYRLAGVTGTCGGQFFDDVFVTDAATADCTVIAHFTNSDTPLTISVDDQRQFARYGTVLDYLVSVTNTGDFVANGVNVTSVASPQLDEAAASWLCLEPDVGVVCPPTGNGMLNTSGVVIPPGRSVQWLVLAPIRADAPGDSVDYSVTVTDALSPDPVSATDNTVLVLFRNGFNDEYDDGANGIAPPPEEQR